jgi:hypothetical protein
MATIEFGRQDFLSGMSNSDASTVIGLSPYSKGHNLRYKEGVLAPQAAKENVTASASLAGKTAVSVGNGGSSGGSGFMILSEDSTKDGYIFDMEVPPGGEGTIGVTSVEDTGRDYDIDKIDIFHDGNDLYSSSNTNIGKGANLGSHDWDWGSSLSGVSIAANSVHHFFRFNTYTYFTNGDKIARSAAGGGTPFTHPITFGALEEVTCAIPHAGKVFVCISSGQEITYSRKVKVNRLVEWDGASSTIDSETPLPGIVYAMASFKGSLLLFFDKFVGIYNGLNIQWLRDINGSSPIYKGKIKQIDNILFYVDGADIIAFDGSKFWCHYTGASNLDVIWNLVGDNLDFIEGDNAYKFDLYDIDGTGKVSSMPKEFGNKVWVRRVRVYLDEDMVSGDSNTIKLYNEGDDATTLTMSYAVDGAVRFKEFRDVNIELSTLRIVLDTFSNLIKRVVVEVDGSSNPSLSK